MPHAPDVIRQLVEKFRYNLEEYKNPHYNEALIRNDFINPFWDALGWDVYNRMGKSRRHRDVLLEDTMQTHSDHRII